MGISDFEHFKKNVKKNYKGRVLPTSRTVILKSCDENTTY